MSLIGEVKMPQVGSVLQVPINMTLTLKVEGKEDFVVTMEYRNTNLDTVKLVENGLMQMFMGINSAK